MNDLTNEDLDRIRAAAQAQAEGLSSVIGPMLDRHTPKPQSPGEFSKHWRYVFAASAMQGFLSQGADKPMRGYEGWRDEFVRQCVSLADTMLAELERNS